MYCVKIPLTNEKWVRDRLSPLFSAAHDLYNEGVAEINRRLEELKLDKEYSEAWSHIVEINEKIEEYKKSHPKIKDDDPELQNLKDEKKPYYKIVNIKRKGKGIDASTFSIQTNILVPIKQANKEKYTIIGTFYNSIAKSLSMSLEKLYYGDGKILHFKSRRQNTTVTCLNGMRVRSDRYNDFQGIKLCYNVEHKLIYITIANINGIKKGTNKKQDYIFPLYINFKNVYIWKNLCYAFDIPFTNREDFYNALTEKVLQQGKKYLTFDKIGPCSLVYEKIRGIERYYIVLNIDGEAFPRFGLNSICDAKNNIVGIDLGTQTVALTFRNKNGHVFKTDLFELVEDVDSDYMNKIAGATRDLERSRRLNNPDNYREDGTIARGKKNWNDSHNYVELKNKISTLNRNKTLYTKISHNLLVKYIMTYAHNIVIEPMDFSALAKKAKETTYRTVEIDGVEVQRANKKKRYGKSVLKKSPALFINTLKEAVKQVGGSYIESDKYETKASQYNHQEDEYIKKSLNTRWNYLYYMGEEVKIQRDLYSSFLLSMMGDDKRINRELCEIGFDDFVELHNVCIKDIKENGMSSALKNIF